jgi:hypothetical protein
VADRKRPFSLLRLTGLPIGTLRRVVAFEAAAPLVVAAVLSAALGLVAAELFLRSLLSVSIRWPGLLYFGGIFASLGVIASTLPLIDLSTASRGRRPHETSERASSKRRPLSNKAASVGRMQDTSEFQAALKHARVEGLAHGSACRLASLTPSHWEGL